MRYLFAGIILMMSSIASAQMKSDYKILPDQEGAVVYQGYCSWSDLSQVPDFAALNDEHGFFKNDASLDFLKKYLPGYSIVIFLGTWCSDSQDLLPPFYELIKKVGFPESELTIVALNREKKAADGIEEQYRITNVPTFILMRNGQEAGRITEQVQVDIEQDLIALIKADRQK